MILHNNRNVVQGITALMFLGFGSATVAADSTLDEIIVTAEKREQSLQDTPIAISVLGAEDLENQGISSLGNLADSTIPSLRIQYFGSSPTTLVIALRGNGAADLGQTTREGVVATYLDGIYLGRAQGLAMEFADLERIEVLRGPQGTLFGRNATGGAINLISKKPSGVFDIEQTFGRGNYNSFRSETHINFPEFAGISAKVDYVHSERDGWVENSAPGEWDYSAYKNHSGRVSLHWQPSEVVDVDYSYDQSSLKASQNYFQLYRDDFGLLGVEDGRQDETRFPISPLDPAVTDQRLHALTISGQVSDDILFKSLTGYRELEEEARNNFGGALFFNGYIFAEDITQRQVTQEFQLIGSGDQWEWVAGLFYFDEDVQQDQQNFFSLDSLGCTTGVPNSPVPVTTIYTTCDTTGVSSFPQPPNLLDAVAESKAVYAQATWTPPGLADRLHITGGLRRTEDEKSGRRFQYVLHTGDLKTSHTDPSLTVSYQWSDDLSTYIKWGTAYRAGGFNVRSTSFGGYDEEEVYSREIGIKSEFWDQRLRFNAAVFRNIYQNMQLDFTDPTNVAITATFNATEDAEVEGFEMDLTFTPLTGLVLGLNYTYLNSDMPPQPNPLSAGGGDPEAFLISQTPEHAGSLAIDYELSALPIGTFIAHLDIFATDQYATSSFGVSHQDAYKLINGRLTLADIGANESRGSFKVSLWGKNLTDEEFVNLSFGIGDPAIAIGQVFGPPRTYGLDLSYEF